VEAKVNMNKTLSSLFPIQKGIQISISIVGLLILVKEMHNLMTKQGATNGKGMK
jgi:hypothetical protein